MKKYNSAILSVISNSVLIIFKVSIGISMGSVSVISEGIHSGIDLLASIIAFFSIKEASKEKDIDHNYGHGKYENLSGFIESLLILLASFMILVQSVKKIIYKSDVHNLGSGIAIMAFAAIINLVISMHLLKVSKIKKSVALEADSIHLMTDVFTSIGVVIGLLLVKITGINIFDPIAAIIVAILILNTAIGLIKKSVIDLVDTSLDKKDVDKIKSIIINYQEIKDYHKLRTRKVGKNYEMDIHLKMDKNMTLEETHLICTKIEKDIKKEYPSSYIVLHPEPYKPII